MKFIISFCFLFVVCRISAQTIHFVSTSTGISFSKLILGYNNAEGNYAVKGLDFGTSIGLGIASYHSGNIGAEIFYAKLNLASAHPEIRLKDRYIETKQGFRLFTRFDINEQLGIKPFFGMNYYNQTTNIYRYRSYNTKKSLPEFGVSLIYKKDRFFFELMLKSFPEFDHLVPDIPSAEYFRIKAFRYPYVGFGLNLLLDDIQDIKTLHELTIEKNKNKYRGLRFNAGIFIPTYSYGLSYQFKEKEGKKAMKEVGVRYGYYNKFKFPDNQTFDTYYALKYHLLKAKKNAYSLNGGAEIGGGFLIWESAYIFMPFPWLLLFLENDFERFDIRIGAGTGLYATIGYKIF